MSHRSLIRAILLALIAFSFLAFLYFQEPQINSFLIKNNFIKSELISIRSLKKGDDSYTKVTINNSNNIYNFPIDPSLSSCSSNDIDIYTVAAVIPIKNNRPDGENSRQVLLGVGKEAEEINKSICNQGYGVKVVVIDENIDSREEINPKIPEKLASDPELVAVIGYTNSEKAGNAIGQFNAQKLPLILPTATKKDLIESKKFVFRSTINNNKIAYNLHLALSNSLVGNSDIEFLLLRNTNIKEGYSTDISNIFKGYISEYSLLEINLESEISDIKGVINWVLKDNKEKHNILVVFPDSTNTDYICQGISQDLISNNLIRNKSMCNAIKTINYINSQEYIHPKKLLNKLENLSIFTADSFYTFIYRSDLLYDESNENLAPIFFSLPWYDCESQDKSWRTQTSQDAISLLKEAFDKMQQVDMSQKLIEERRIALKEELEKLRPNGEVTENIEDRVGKIVKLEDINDDLTEYEVDCHNFFQLE